MEFEKTGKSSHQHSIIAMSFRRDPSYDVIPISPRQTQDIHEIPLVFQVQAYKSTNLILSIFHSKTIHNIRQEKFLIP